MQEPLPLPHVVLLSRYCVALEGLRPRAVHVDGSSGSMLPNPQHCGLLNRNALTRDAAGYLGLENARRVVDIQGERTPVRIAVFTQSECFTEVDSSHKVSVNVIRPYAVREFVGPPTRVLPRSQADGARSRINIRVVNLGPTGIPNLVSLLDGLITEVKPDVPKANDRRVFIVVLGRLRGLLHQTRLSLDRSSSGYHRGQGIAARG